MPRYAYLQRIVPKCEGKREVPLTPAPRPVPLGAYAVTYFGGTLSIFGWVLLALSSIPVWTFPLKSELMAPIVFFGAVARTKGTILSEEHLGGRYRRRQLLTTTGRVAGALPEVPLTKVNFAYTVNGMTYEGFSFTPIGREIPRFGSQGYVAVEYVVADPTLARIVGMRFFYYAWSVSASLTLHPPPLLYLL